MSKLICAVTFLLGFAFPVSTALQNTAMVLLLVLSVLDKDSRSYLRDALKTPFVICSLIMYSLFLLGIFWSSGSNKDIIHMLTKMDLYLFVPLLMALFYNHKYKMSLFYGFALGVMLGVILSLISAVIPYHFFDPKVGIMFDYNGHMLHTFRGHTYQNYFAGLLSVALFAIMLSSKISPRLKWLFTSVIVLCIVDVFFVMTGRTGQILFLLMFVLLLIQWRAKLGLIISAILIFLVVPALIYFSPKLQYGINMYMSDMSKYSAGDVDTSVGARVEFHRVSKLLIADKPIFGHGTGSYNTEFIQAKSKAISQNPHNDYLWFGVELGVLGILSLFLMIGSTLYHAYLAKLPYRWLGVILTTTYIVSCFENSFFTDNITGQAFVVFICALFAGTNIIKKPKSN